MMTEQEYKELQERNLIRARERIKEMGEKYLCHPANQMTKSKFRKILRTSKKAQLNHG
jgi:DNA-binding transcriptional MocR family regulator